MVCVVAPLDQRYAANPAPASSVAEPPLQTDTGPVIAAVGNATTETVCWAEVVLQPPLLVTVTE